jgi:signal peptidase I
MIGLVVIVLGQAPAYVHAYVITPQGVSEVPTILAGDTVIVNHAAYDLKFPYTNWTFVRTGAPVMGEMVLVRLPKRGVAPKRVMGLPGDTIELRENRLIVNGHTVAVTALDRSKFTWIPDADKAGSTVEDEHGHWITYSPGMGKYRNHSLTRLTSDQYFVLGDNRDESEDSREWGPITRDRILGRVSLILPTGPRR